MVDANKKALPVGISDFAKLIDGGYYYVDKTSFLKELFDNSSDKCEVRLITRPRRFGKSLILSTIKYFFGLNLKDPDDRSYAQKLFCNLQIMRDQDFCARFLGRFPVIFLSFKDVFAEDFASACGALASRISMLCEDFNFLSESPKLSASFKQKFCQMLDDEKMADDPKHLRLCNSLQLLIRLLHLHFGKKPVLLIDEYDVPLSKAARCGYYDQMAEIMRRLLSSSLKDNEDLQSAVLTGCLRVSEESIFTGLNNLKVNSLSSENSPISGMIGFSHAECEEMLRYYGLSQYSLLVSRWYDGYNVGGCKLFCHWDLMLFCQEAVQNPQGQMVPRSFWLGTGSTDELLEFMGYLEPRDCELMQDLLDGKSIEIELNEQLNYQDILRFHRSRDFWTLLLSTGYLTVVSLLDGDDLQRRCLVRIPNLGITECFRRSIVFYFGNDAKIRSDSQNIVRQLLLGEDPQSIKLELRKILKRFVSVRDLAAKATPELYYQGFMNGLFSNSANCLDDFASNAEAGDGYADAILRSADLDTGVILEYKSINDPCLLDKMSDQALKQIDEKRYAEFFLKSGSIPKKILGYGIAFCRKECSVSMARLDPLNLL